MRYFTDKHYRRVIRVHAEHAMSPDFQAAHAEEYHRGRGWVTDPAVLRPVLVDPDLRAIDDAGAEQILARLAAASNEPAVLSHPLIPRRALLQLHAFTAKIRSGGATVVVGLPASGKSTVAKYLSGCVGATLLDADSVGTQHERLEPGGDRGNAAQHGHGSGHGNDEHSGDGLLQTALALGRKAPVVVTGPFEHEVGAAVHAGRSLAEHLTAGAGSPTPVVHTVWLSAFPEQIHDRMTRRNEPNDLTALEDWDNYRDRVLGSGLGYLGPKVTDHLILT